MVRAAAATALDLLLVGATEHPSVLSGGRFRGRRGAADPGRRRGRRRSRRARRDARRGCRRAASGRWSRSCSPTTRPAPSSRSPRSRGSPTRPGAIVHTDAVQAAGRIPVDIAALGVDVLTLSAHKIGGPQGAGAIVRASDDLTFAPLLTGGGQEKRLRAGTENVAAIAGFGAAADAAPSRISAMARRWAALARAASLAIVGASGDGDRFLRGAPRLPQTLCVAIDGIPAETLLIALDLAGVAVSSGSACSSGKVAPEPCACGHGRAAETSQRRHSPQFRLGIRPNPT